MWQDEERGREYGEGEWKASSPSPPHFTPPCLPPSPFPLTYIFSAELYIWCEWALDSSWDSSRCVVQKNRKRSNCTKSTVDHHFWLHFISGILLFLSLSPLTSFPPPQSSVSPFLNFWFLEFWFFAFLKIFDVLEIWFFEFLEIFDVLEFYILYSDLSSDCIFSNLFLHPHFLFPLSPNYSSNSLDPISIWHPYLILLELMAPLPLTLYLFLFLLLVCHWGSNPRPTI